MPIFTGTFFNDTIMPGFLSPLVLSDPPFSTPSGLADTLYGGGGDDALSGGGGADFLYGGTGDDLLYGGPGNDWLLGGTGNDDLYGLSGNDILDGNAGADAMYGGSGDDLYFVDNVGDAAVDSTAGAAGGFDTVRASVAFTLGANIEDLVLTGAAGINGTGNGLDNRISGNGANNVLYGGGGADELRGGAGDDRLYGGTGADLMIGGAGDDRYSVDNGDVVTELAGGGTDTVITTLNYAMGPNIENLTLATGPLTAAGNELNNVIIGTNSGNFLFGGEGADTLSGLAGDDILYGDDDADVIAGGSGDDLIYGGASNDALLGEAGADILIGDAGADVLTGATGADTFKFGANHSSTIFRDTIRAGGGAVAFEGPGLAAGDRVDVSGIDAIALIADNQAFLWGGAGATAVKSIGYLWVEDVGSDTYVRGNVDFDASAEFELEIEDGALVLASAYASGDFIL